MDISENSPPKIILVTGIFLFALIAIAALVVAVVSVIDMYINFFRENNTVVMHKGIFYLFGVGVGLLALVYDGVYSKILEKQLSQFAYQAITRIAIAGLVIMIFLPHIIHYGSESSFVASGYQVCEEKSTQWLFVRKIVYTLPGSCE